MILPCGRRMFIYFVCIAKIVRHFRLKVKPVFLVIIVQTSSPLRRISAAHGLLLQKPDDEEGLPHKYLDHSIIKSK